MPKTIETTVYTFDELPDKAKDSARQWYLSGIGYHQSDEVVDENIIINEYTFTVDGKRFG